MLALEARIEQNFTGRRENRHVASLPMIHHNIKASARIARVLLTAKAPRVAKIF